MRFFEWAKDGGPKSPVDAYFLIECKKLFSIAILKFNRGGRENYHTHAFHALTWFLFGDLIEEDFSGVYYTYQKSVFPKITLRNKNHRVFAYKNSWCFTIRGPWKDIWTEHTPEGKKIIFTHGRKEISERL